MLCEPEKKKTFQVVLKCNVVHGQRKKTKHTVTYKFEAWLMADACEL